ncbi:MAG: cobalt-precorrin-5B (C(1))-methyltransferase CbiD [Lachnospiraceae bacterium]|nr:cobalt-precorrin-5B (C(1))-methyltransferase CbiD [Lachnospiraceae bacterium]
MAIKTLDEGEGKYLYSTFGKSQQVECVHGTHITGALTEVDMLDVCRKNEVKLIVDAAHPFAINLHNTIGTVANELGLPVIRLERIYPPMPESGIVWCEDFEDAIKKMEALGVNKLLALTGVNTIPKLKKYWNRHETWFRVLNRIESIEEAQGHEFPKDHLVFYEKHDTDKLIGALNPDAIITKESGVTGGVEEKVRAATANNVKLFIVRRPKLPDNFIIVDGRHGLRMEIERLLPDFYTLHTGFTTGSCATAAAKAALWGLLKGEKLSEVRFLIPEGETMKMDVESVEISESSAVASVIKNAGDDPDVTDKSRITVSVSYNENNGITFKGGAGIGTVTLPGIGLEVGQPAINPVPREMITNELSSLYSGGLEVTVTVENGEELSAKTFNPRVGVVGGISIIGTTGIVRPFSHEAFVQAIRREMEVALAVGCKRIVVNSGGKSERSMKTLYRDLSPQAFIHYGNAIGDTMALANELNVPELTVGLMLGKAVKLAEGNMDTHSHKITVNRDFLCGIAIECDCSDNAVNTISQINMARELWSALTVEDSDRFFPTVLQHCFNHCSSLYYGNLEAVLIDDEGKIRYKL